MEKRLAAHGIHTVRDLCERSKDELRTIWGGVGGEIMHERLRGEEQHEAEGDTHSISHSSVLGPDRRTPELAFAVMNRLVQKAAMRLRKAGYYAARLSIGLKYLDGSRWDAEMRLVDTQDTVTFLHALDKMWAKRPRTGDDPAGGHGLFGPVPEDKRTGTLFARGQVEEPLLDAG
jgi:DNA polymerase-4